MRPRPYTSFEEVSSRVELAASLEFAYGGIEAVDLWIGAMAEDHLDGANVGETLATALAMQFRHLRDGDRFFFLADWSTTIKTPHLVTTIIPHPNVNAFRESVTD